MLLLEVNPIHPTLLRLACLAALLATARAVSGADDKNLVAESQAVAGEPLGVARVRFRVPDPASIAPGEERFNLAGDLTRILYPVFFADPAPAGPGGRAAPIGGFELWFLFSGKEPISLCATTNLSANRYREFRAALDPAPPAEGPKSHRALLSRWWSAYREVLAAVKRDDLYYPVVESYLLWHLPELLDLQGEAAPAAVSAPRALQAFPEAEELVDLLLGTESLRIALQRETLLDGGSGAAERPSVPLPPGPGVPPVAIPPAPADLRIEKLAMYAPAECLYAWFPRFADFQAILRRVETWGGNLYDVVAARSFDAGARELIETQLALKQSALSRLFGDFVIGEMAVVAQDTFVREGSALGVLFEVRNETLFLTAIQALRAEAIAASRERPGGPAAVERLEIRGRPVELLRAPGNRIRSFHLSSGPVHLVTNCRRLAERFLECADEKKGSLASDAAFRHAREMHPLELPQQAFVFMSDAFVNQLIGPAYRAEMLRRAKARAALELVEVARLTARAETGRTFTLAELVSGGYLPAASLRRPEGAEIVETPGGTSDSLRGSRGTFLPIPDVGVDALTPAEARAYEEFAQFYRRQWERVDPAAIRIWLDARAAPATPAGAAAGDSKAKAEEVRLVVDILPVAREPYLLLRGVLGPISRRSLSPPPEEIFTVQAEMGSLAQGRPSWAGAGLLDFEAPLALGGLPANRFFEDPASLPAYLILPITGRLPDGGLKAVFITTAPAADGFQRVEGELAGVRFWAREHGDWIVLSPRKEVARRMAESILFVEEGSGQVRLRVASLASRRAAPALRAEALGRTRRASQATAAFLSMLHGVLKVPIAECPGAARAILAQGVACPAGGRFMGSDWPVDGAPFFASDAFGGRGKPAAREAEEFRHPLLDELIGLEISFSLTGQSLHSEARMTLRPAK